MIYALHHLPVSLRRGAGPALRLPAAGPARGGRALRPQPARCAPSPRDAEPGVAVSQLEPASFNPLEAMRSTTDPRERAKLLQLMDNRWSECQVGLARGPPSCGLACRGPSGLRPA
jgi:hypothetical protein